MSDVVIESGTAEAVAFRLMKDIMDRERGAYGREETLRLYAECLAAVRGPVAQDLLDALKFEDLG